MLTKATLPQIAPTSHSRADKYSLNLWRWCKKHLRTDRNRLVVAIATKDGKTYDPTKTQACDLYIGYGDIDDGWLHGSRLSEILGAGTKAASWAFQPWHNFVIVPDWWDRYAATGKCVIDPEHTLYLDKERWAVSEDGRERTCTWCDHHTQYQYRQLIIKKEWRRR